MNAINAYNKQNETKRIEKLNCDIIQILKIVTLLYTRIALQSISYDMIIYNSFKHPLQRHGFYSFVKKRSIVL